MRRREAGAGERARNARRTDASPAARAPNPTTDHIARAQRLAGNAAVARAMRAVAPGPGPGAVVVQRLYGFEFQSSGNAFISTGSLPVREKEQFVRAPDFTVEADQGSDATHFDIEFVTKPRDAAGSAAAAVQAAAAAKAIADATETEPDRTKTFTSGTAIAATTWARDVTVKVGDPAFWAKPQATVGVDLEHVYKLLLRTVGGEAAFDNVLASRRPRGASARAHGLLDMIAFYVGAAARPNPAPRRDDLPEEIFGKDPASAKYFPYGPEVLLADGPKVLFGVMARTDFHQMYLSLSQEDKEYVQRVVADDDRVLSAFGRRRRWALFRSPFRADPDFVKTLGEDAINEATIKMLKAADGRSYPVVIADKLTVGDWLDSIVRGTDRSGRRREGDLLSPPPGWGARAPDRKNVPPSPDEIRDNFVYGMGAYPMVDGRALFEVRNIARKIARDDVVPAAGWGEATELMIKDFLKYAHDAW